MMYEIGRYIQDVNKKRREQEKLLSKMGKYGQMKLKQIQKEILIPTMDYSKLSSEGGSEKGGYEKIVQQLQSGEESDKSETSLLSGIGAISSMKFGFGKKSKEDIIKGVRLSANEYDQLCYDITKRVRDNQERETKYLDQLIQLKPKSIQTNNNKLQIDNLRRQILTPDSKNTN